ncbi:MAG: hypothetical protein ORN49_00285 [Rhodobacteraceae bacterium]|nr:hypothetical protein [Paracoccaceae bacterium]
MTFQSRLALIAALWAATASQTLAAPATPEGASHLTEVLQRYLGKTDGVVTVTPQGETYAVTLDATPLFALTSGKEAITLSAQHLTLTDQGGGLWKVVQDEPAAFAISLPGTIDAKVQIGKLMWNGLYDESLSSFQSWTSDMTDMVYSQKTTPTTETPGQEITEKFAAMHSEFSATKSLTVGVDGSYSWQASGFQETMTMAQTAEQPAGQSVAIVADSVSQSGTFKGLRSAPLLDLVAFFVAHPSEAAIKADQEALRSQVQAALPFFEALDGTITYKGLSVNTPYGGGKADSIGGDLSMSGLIADGRLREKLTVSGLTLDEGLAPDWAEGLVPTDFTLDVEGKNFNLADPASILVGALDMAKEPPLSEAVGSTLLPAFLPTGSFDLTFAPGQVVAPLYQIDFDGAMTVAVSGTPPTGQGTIKAKGMDAVIEALNKGPAEVAQGIGPVLTMARGIAKPGGVGELVWKLDGTTPGTLKVNDLDLSALGAMMNQ